MKVKGNDKNKVKTKTKFTWA